MFFFPNTLHYLLDPLIFDLSPLFNINTRGHKKFSVSTTVDAAHTFFQGFRLFIFREMGGREKERERHV